MTPLRHIASSALVLPDAFLARGHLAGTRLSGPAGPADGSLLGQALSMTAQGINEDRLVKEICGHASWPCARSLAGPPSPILKPSAVSPSEGSPSPSGCLRSSRGSAATPAGEAVRGPPR